VKVANKGSKRAGSDRIRSLLLEYRLCLLNQPMSIITSRD